MKRHAYQTHPSRAFTLIELLAVIAIIAVLSAITFSVLPKVMERARISKAIGAMQQIQTALTGYIADHGTYPPMYGTLDVKARDIAIADLDYSRDFHLAPYMAVLKRHRQADLYDNFSESGDSNRDHSLSLLEFSPVGQTAVATGFVTFDRSALFLGNNLPTEVMMQKEETSRPFTYIGVNKAQANQAKRYWIESGDFNAETWNPDASNALRNISFPPPVIDTYVLISMGPAKSTFGLLDNPPAGDYPTAHTYHIAALRAYYLATRDLNSNGLLDFDFRARTQQNEGAATFTVSAVPASNQLPDPVQPNGAGPLIMVLD